MDELVKKIEIPLAKRAVEKAGLYIVPKEEFGKLSQVAADAYEGYPLHVWFAGKKFDPCVTRLVIECSLKSMSEDAVIYADSKEMNGFAVWLPPGFTGSKAIPFIKNGGMRLIFHSGPGIVKKLMGFESFAMKLKKKYTGNVDWYLYNVSVLKKAQKQGIATKLLKPMIEFCDKENIAAYLETNKESNVSIYKHFGFALSEELPVPKSNVMHYAMTRSPNPPEEKYKNN